MVVVVILAGGASSRFLAGDKLFYPIRGRPLIKYVVDSVMRCRCVTKIVALSSQLNSNRVSEYIETVEDPLQIGPLGALYLALKMYREVLLIGGDMPFITCTCLDTVLEYCRDTSVFACIPQYNHFLEPLLSVYRRPLLDIVEYGIVNRVLSLQRLIKILRVPIKVIDISDLDELKKCLININSVEDIEHYNLHHIPALL